VATVAGIEQAGCTPVFADIDRNSRCVAPKSIEERISSNTRAIMPVHIYGQPAEMQKILEVANFHNLDVIEDCSQAHGAEIQGQKVGTFADISAYSCYPTKNLGGTGDGGVILCKSKEFSEKIKSLRQYGWNQARECIIPGFNSRLDEMQAAILRVKLKHLADDNAKRRAIALRYNKGFKDLPITLPALADTELHAMHLYVIECDGIPPIQPNWGKPALSLGSTPTHRLCPSNPRRGQPAGYSSVLSKKPYHPNVPGNIE
jgi:dTDP-4-amino-4,6-dideoxygalactose transaminase